MKKGTRNMVVSAAGNVVLDGNDLQRCPDCGESKNLRLCAISPHAVVWCRCQRAWPYPTLSYSWLVDSMDLLPIIAPSTSWTVGEPIPAAVLERWPGLDILVDTVESVCSGGYVDSHQRLDEDDIALTYEESQTTHLPAGQMNSPVAAAPITRTSGPAGSSVIKLESENAGKFEIRGRVVAVDLPCTVGARGCGGEHTMTVVRAPLFGMNMPGEQIVGTIEHCTVCGPSPAPPRLVTPTPFEIDHGWAPGTVG
jgi:hypothetical protein